MLNIYFIRHCKVDYTPEGLIRDQKHLSQEGRQQAIELKKNLQTSGLEFDAIYTSDMMRGIETVIPYALEENKKIISRAEFQEVNVNGILEIGDNVLNTFLRESRVNTLFKHPSGETLINARKRYIRAIQKIIRKYPSGNILIVTHGLIFREFLKHYFPKDPIDQLVISNPDIYKVQIKNTKIISYNKVEELIPHNAIVRHHS